jgi:signal transduction histidine kinase
VLSLAGARLATPSVWQRPRPTREQVRGDVLLGLGLAALSSITVELLRATPAGAGLEDRGLESHVWAVVAVVPLVLRRVFPITVMLVCSVAFYLTGERVPVVGYSAVVQVALFMAIYTAWAWARRRTALRAASTLVVLGMFGWLAQLIATADPIPGVDAAGVVPPEVAVAVMTLGLNVVYFFGAIAWGSASHRSARQRELLQQQTEELRHERDLKARRAVADERLRIARDLHDVVAHHVTGIGVQAAAARHVMERNPTASSEALAQIEGSSRAAVQEMHQLVGLLRADEGPVHERDSEGRPTGLAALRELAARPGSLRVEYDEVGEPFPVPPAVARSAYRIVQEALTNVRRHSTARNAAVVLRYLDRPGGRSIEVEVIDDGVARRDDTGAGFGLQGIRERVELHGGQHEIGPRPGPGFRVRARLPVGSRP